MVSQKLKVAVKTAGMRSYQIAHEADLHPSTLSQLINGIIPVKKNDSRVVKVGKVLGLKPKECFACEKES